MSNKKPLPTWEDTGLDSARSWKPSVREVTVSKSEAEKKLKDGFSVSDLTGNAATFSDDDTIHWRKNLTEKAAAAALGRMIRLHGRNVRLLGKGNLAASQWRGSYLLYRGYKRTEPF